MLLHADAAMLFADERAARLCCLLRFDAFVMLRVAMLILLRAAAAIRCHYDAIILRRLRRAMPRRCACADYAAFDTLFRCRCRCRCCFFAAADAAIC